MNRADAKLIIGQSLDKLFQLDLLLLRNDVSERAITHKLAEYMQPLVGDLNVDCEYNRNVDLGAGSPKYLLLARHERQHALGDRAARDVLEEELKEYSTYPDIVVHRRGTNDANTLVVEVKKVNSQVGDQFDLQKLLGFTDTEGPNAYHYQHGVFIRLETGVNEPRVALVRWFPADGQEEP